MSGGRPSLIASDVDGTLLDDQNRITDATVEAITRASRAGVDLVLATGRPPRWIAEVTNQLPVPDDLLSVRPGGTLVRYAVCANGAIVYDVENDRILDAVQLDVPRLRKLISVVEELLPQAGLAAERVGVSAHDAATRPFVATAGYEHAWLNPDHELVDDADLGEAPAVKLLARAPQMRSEDMAALLVPAVGDLAEVTFSTSNGLIELSVPNTHKAAGLARLAGLTGLPADAVIAFGDMPNDVEMLRWATHGAAMAHGHPEAIAAADEVAPTNNDDGVATVLSRFF
ncbi:HAD family hydrolase [Gordonia sp. X0973]|uniref:HAD family hydrolase n=1 Tax=Gordonia sp. X0973 TaxID=2742602 RepID=UPI000F53673E|nr:HAD family hydrolase [Gordonia sp. X0973]QKT05858.1 HAD family hydrolase [Gordonia sp. X0973]